jgi:trimethylguanosine synthase
MGAPEETLPEGAHHYDKADEVPFEVSKYWHQRHQIFSRYDEGIWMTDDAWFGVTPEPVAKKIAEHVSAAPKSRTIMIDAFAGAGGNTIAFALSGRWKQIFAVEKDANVLACAKHNAAVYGVQKKIVWINGDIFDILHRRFKSLAKSAVIFGSPPWGGESSLTWKRIMLTDRRPFVSRL